MDRAEKEGVSLPSQDGAYTTTLLVKLSSHDGSCRLIMEGVKVAHCFYVQARFFSKKTMQKVGFYLRQNL
jgi:hypothetical protein